MTEAPDQTETSIKPHENPKANEAVIEVRLFVGGGKTHMVTAHLKNLPHSHKRRANHFSKQVGPVVAAVVAQYLKGHS